MASREGAATEEREEKQEAQQQQRCGTPQIAQVTPTGSAEHSHLNITLKSLWNKPVKGEPTEHQTSELKGNLLSIKEVS